MVLAPPPFDATALSDEQLLLLESTLRVQLEMDRYVKAAVIVSSVGAAVLSGGLSVVTSGAGMAFSFVQRRRCRKRYVQCCLELSSRDLEPKTEVDEKKLGKRAWTLASATGFACCALGFALDLLVDHAVLQVLNELFTIIVDDKIASRLENYLVLKRTGGTSMQELASTSTKLMAPTPQETAPDAVDSVVASGSETDGTKRNRVLHKALTWSGVRSVWELRPDSWRRAASATTLPAIESDCAEDLFGPPSAHRLRTLSSLSEDESSIDEGERGSLNSPSQLFGSVERDSLGSPGQLFGSVEVRRTNEFDLFGECYTFRFTTMDASTALNAHPEEGDAGGARDGEQMLPGRRTAAMFSTMPVEGRGVANVCLFGEDLLSDEQWRQLWMDESPEDEANVEAEDERRSWSWWDDELDENEKVTVTTVTATAIEKQSTEKVECDLFGAPTTHWKTGQGAVPATQDVPGNGKAQYNLFGTPISHSRAAHDTGEEPYDLFGVSSHQSHAAFG